MKGDEPPPAAAGSDGGVRVPEAPEGGGKGDGKRDVQRGGQLPR